ncbi:MAG: hypothetical protein IOMNBAOH_01745 [Rhodocyclaceae bacterium]|nr:hypothetical protein [Rhodocyclaceae bacterium]
MAIEAMRAIRGLRGHGDRRLVTTEKRHVMKARGRTWTPCLRAASHRAYGERLREGEAYCASIFDRPPDSNVSSGEASSARGHARLAGSRFRRFLAQ